MVIKKIVILQLDHCLLSNHVYSFDKAPMHMPPPIYLPSIDFERWSDFWAIFFELDKSTH